MSNNPLWVGLFIGALLLAGSGCATTSVPDDWQSTARMMQREAYGAWVEVSYADSAQPQRVMGELIAASADSVHVLPPDSSLQSVARSTIGTLRLATFDANWGYLGIWTTLGTLSTLSHGLILVFSAPVWLIGGSAATSRQSYRPIFTNPDLQTLRKYARFPQGLPPGLERDQLRPKPME